MHSVRFVFELRLSVWIWKVTLGGRGAELVQINKQLVPATSIPTIVCNSGAGQSEKNKERKKEKKLRQCEFMMLGSAWVLCIGCWTQSRPSLHCLPCLRPKQKWDCAFAKIAYSMNEISSGLAAPVIYTPLAFFGWWKRITATTAKKKKINKNLSNSKRNGSKGETIF